MESRRHRLRLLADREAPLFPRGHVDDTLSVAPQLPTLAGIPTVLIWGAADPFQPVSVGDRFAADLGAPLERIEGGKHFTPEDHPGEIARGVNELVRVVAS